MLQDLNHRHIMVTASGCQTPLKTVEDVHAWMVELVAKVDMKILMGPYVTRCETDGNEGVTGVVCIETSHASIHIWDTGCEPFAKMDLYSCKEFSDAAVVEHFAVFSPSEIDVMVVDRNGVARVAHAFSVLP